MRRWLFGLAVAAVVLLAPSEAAAEPITATLVATTLAKLVISTVIGFALQALSPKPKAPKLADASDRAGGPQLIRSSIEPHQEIDGTARVSGPLVLAETTGAANEFLHLVVPLAAHEVEAIDSVWLNDVEITNGQLDGNGVVTSGRFANRVRIKKHPGSDSQTADTALVAEVSNWTTAHRGRGIAYIYLRLTWDLDTFPTGIPNVSAVVKGAKFWDPRLDPGDPSVKAFSNNAALAQLDYLMRDIGFALPLAEIHEASWVAAANVCDENVTLKAGGTQKRYTCDGAFHVDAKPLAVMADLLTASAGTLVFQQDQFRGYAAAAATSSFTLDESDLRGPVRVVTRPSRAATFNAIRGTFVNAADNYLSADFPPITNATFESEDAGERVFRDIELPFTTNVIRARRIAKIHLERHRQGETLTFPAKLTALGIAAHDLGGVSIGQLNYAGKDFRVLGWSLATDGGVDLHMQEESSSVYDWTPATDEEDIATPGATTPPDPLTVATPAGITFSEELRVTASGSIIMIVFATVNPITDSFLSEYEMEFRKSGATDFSNAGRQTNNVFELVGLEDGTTYNVRARAINSLGVKSSFVTVNHQVAGQTVPPADVTNFAINIVDDSAFLSWDAVADLDLSHYRVRWSPATAGASWSGAVDLIPKVARPATAVEVPARVGSYLIKAVDLIGIESTNATIIVSTISAIADLNVVETKNEHPGFTGAKTTVVAVDNTLKLDSTNLFDSLAGNFDAAPGLFDGGGGSGNFAATGTYDFAAVVDLTAVYTSRVTASITMTAGESINTFDNAPGNFDAREGLFDGEAPSFVNVKLQISTTDDDPGGAPAWSAYRDFAVGDYKARGLRFRAILTSSVVSATPIVSALTVTVDMPDRTIAANDLVALAAGSAITFSPAFKALQGVGIAAQDLATGDYWAITAKSATGFTIRFFNSSDVGISRTFDYLAKGYGALAA